MTHQPRYTLEEITFIGQRMADSECLEELDRQCIEDDGPMRDLVCEFYRRHRRACITIAKYAGQPVTYGLFLASLPF